MSTAPTPTWADRLPFRPAAYFLGIVIALGLSTAVIRIGSSVITVSASSAVRWQSAVHWAAVGVLALLVVRFEKLPLRTLFPGRPALGALGIAVVFAVILRFLGPVPLLVAAIFLPRRPTSGRRALIIWGACFAASLVAGMLVFATLVETFSLGEAPAGNRGRAFLTRLSILDRLIIVITAAFTEEVRYRSYLIERLHGLRLWPGVAAVVSYVIFVAGHIPFFGLEQVLRVTAVGGAAFPILYYLTRNFWACFALHFLLDVFLLAA